MSRRTGRHAANAHAFFPFLDLNLRDTGLLQQLDEFLDFSNVHARGSPLRSFWFIQLEGPRASFSDAMVESVRPQRLRMMWERRPLSRNRRAMRPIPPI